MSIASDSTGNPIVVTGTCSSSEVIATGQIYVKWIYWYQPSTAAHLLTIVDAHGKSIVPAYCENANESQWLPIYKTCDDIYCTKIESGSLYIYIK